jgi:hypothetical protein
MRSDFVVSGPRWGIFALIPSRDFVLPSLNPSPLGRDFSPPNPPRWGGYLVEIHRVKYLSSFIGSPTPTPPSRAGYLGAISSRDILELNREEGLTRSGIVHNRYPKQYVAHWHAPSLFSIELKHSHASQLFSLKPNHSQATELFSIELKYVTHSIVPRYPPKDGGIRGVEVPPSGRDLGWEKKSPAKGLGRKKSPIGIQERQPKQSSTIKLGTRAARVS